MERTSGFNHAPIFPSAPARCSLIVVNYGNQHLAGNLLRSLAGHPDRALIHEVVVVDNGYPSKGDSRDTLAGRTWPFPVRFAQFHGHSYSGSINLGAQGCTGDLLLLANNDIEWLPRASMVPVVRHMLDHPEVGIAGPQLLFPDGRWQRSAGSFPSILEALGRLFFFGNLSNRAQALSDWWNNGNAPAYDVEFVDGACMVVSRECFESLGGWDPAFDFSGCDAYFNWQAKEAGWRRTLVPGARLMHIRGASTTRVTPLAYTKRLYEAKRRMVERMRGGVSAAGYDLLQRLVALEYAFIFGLFELLWPTAASTRRANAAWASGLAALPTTTPRTGPPQNISE